MAQRRWTAIWAGLTVLPLLAFTQGGEGRRVLQADASLRAAPGSTTLLGMLTSGAPVTVLGLQDEWAQIRVDGWIPASALGAPAEPGPAPSAAPSSLPPAPPPAPSVAGSAVQGLISVELGRRHLTGEGVSVYLLPAGIAPRWDGESAADRERVQALEEEARRLDEEARRAMRGSSFMDAMQRSDDLKRQRDRRMTERGRALTALHARHEAEARASSLAAAVADERGVFTLLRVAPGAYTVYARLIRGEVDVEWMAPLTLGGADARLDLDAATARGLPPVWD